MQIANSSIILYFFCFVPIFYFIFKMAFPRSSRTSSVERGQYSSPLEGITLHATMVDHDSDEVYRNEQNHSPSAASVPPMSTPPMSEPAPGRHGGNRFVPPLEMAIVQAIVRPTTQSTLSTPALYYARPAMNPVVYPLAPSLLGQIWHTDAELRVCTFLNIKEDNAISFCSKRTNMPEEMVESLIVNMEQNRGGVRFNIERLS